MTCSASRLADLSPCQSASFSLGGQNGSIVIDLSAFTNISVDASGIAQVGAGARLGNLALGIYNQSRRALPHGVCPGVGVGGHASHGGYCMPLAAYFGDPLTRI